MIFKQRATGFCVGLVMSLALGAVASGQTWDSINDFSATQNPSNGWSYGWTPSLGGAFNPFPQPGQTCGADFWVDPSISAISLGRNATPGTVSCFSWSFPTSYMLAHPGPNGQYTVLRWTPPGPGSYGVSVAITGLDYSFPTTTDVHIRWDGADVSVVNVNSFLNVTTYQATLLASASTIFEIAIGDGGNGYVGDATGVRATITGACSIPAQSLSVGVGCGGVGGLPVLAAGLPAIGSTVMISASHLPPAATGSIFVGPAITPPLNLGSGCFVYIDVASSIPFLPITADANGHWSVPVPIPNDPQLINLQFSMQAYAASGSAFGLTNALAIRIGC